MSPSTTRTTRRSRRTSSLASDGEKDEATGESQNSNAKQSAEDGDGHLRRRKEFDALHQEMELVAHGVSRSGHAKRKIPKNQSKVRTQKRKLLERQEDAERNGMADEYEKVECGARSKAISSRLRGSKAAAEESVVQGSLIFAEESFRSKIDETGQRTRDSPHAVRSDEDYDAASTSNEDEEQGVDMGSEQEDELDQLEVDSTDEEVIDDIDIYESEDDDIVESALGSTPTSPLKSKPTAKKLSKHQGTDRQIHDETRTKTKKPVRKSRRPQQQRLRNFRSCKMAERHGAALGAHVQGKPTLAIRRLKQVAASAPAAPQIYSSLGMVYEDMLQASQRKNIGGMATLEATDGFSASDHPNDSTRDNHSLSRTTHDDTAIQEQLQLAKKAYGSYHIAAIFCKRDYSLWLRAGDSAFEIAGLHTSSMQLPGISDALIQYHRSEKHRWLEEAKHDYQMADNLKPPGIDISAKLGYTMIELGLLSEALTLLTDLKTLEAFEGTVRRSDATDWA